MPAPVTKRAACDPPRARSHTMCKGNNGCLTRPSISTNAVSSIGLATSATMVAVAPHPCVSALEKPNTSANSPNVQVSTPGMSIQARPGGLWLTSNRNATSVVGTAITRLTYKHQRHESTCVNTPPSRSPSAPAPPATAPKIPNAFGQSAVPANVTVKSDSAAGANSAANTPCVARAATSTSNDCAGPPTADATENPTNPAISAHLRPNRSPTFPPTNNKLPNANAYAVTTHCRLSFEKCNARWAEGKATVTIVASSTTINCATLSKASTAQRLGSRTSLVGICARLS